MGTTPRSGGTPLFGRGVNLAYGRFRVASHRSEPRSAPSQRACLVVARRNRPPVGYGAPHAWQSGRARLPASRR